MLEIPASRLTISGISYTYYAPETLALSGFARAGQLFALPFSIKILLENQMRNIHLNHDKKSAIDRLVQWRQHPEARLIVLPTQSIDPHTREPQQCLPFPAILENNFTLMPEIIQLNTSEVTHHETPTKAAENLIRLKGWLNAFGIFVLEHDPNNSLDNNNLTSMTKTNPFIFRVPRITGIEILSTQPNPKEEPAIHSPHALVLRQIDTLDIKGQHLEFFGPGLQQLPIQSRTRIAQHCIACGATQALFPIDTISVQNTNATSARLQIIKDYASAVGLWYESKHWQPEFDNQYSITA